MQRLNPPAQLTRCAHLAAVPAQLSPGLVRALTHPATVTLLKTAVTQLVYETSSGAAYLSLQAGLRGRGLRGIIAELRAKLWGVWRDGLLFWTVAHMAVAVSALNCLIPNPTIYDTRGIDTRSAHTTHLPCERTLHF